MPTLKGIAEFFGITSERQMAAKLGVKPPISTLALIKAYEKLPPVAHFAASPSDGLVPLAVNFTDQSRGYIKSRLWDFGDGQTSTDENPEHTYHVTNCGQFFPTLTVKNEAGQDKYYLPVTVRPPMPTAKIGASPTSGPAPLRVQFTDQSEIECFLDRTWNFPNGDAVPQADPVFTFENSGTETTPQQVTLAVHNPSGTSTTGVTIQVGPRQSPPPSSMAALKLQPPIKAPEPFPRDSSSFKATIGVVNQGGSASAAYSVVWQLNRQDGSLVYQQYSEAMPALAAGASASAEAQFNIDPKETKTLEIQTFLKVNDQQVDTAFLWG